MQIAKHLEKPLTQYMDLQLCVAVSLPFRSPEQLRTSYYATRDLFVHRFYQDKPRPIFMETAVPFTRTLGQEFLDLASEFNRIISEFSGDKLDSWIDRLKHLSLRTMPDPDILLAWFSSLHKEQESEDMAAIHSWPDMQSASNLFTALEFVQNWAHARNQISNNLITVRPEIAKAIKYIKNHLHEELSLEIVAGKVLISTSYLSRLFREETGSSFVDYILECRIELAKTYLSSGEYRNFELIEKVGFHSYSYFCTIFKKKTGMTPNEYKNSVKPKFYKK